MSKPTIGDLRQVVIEDPNTTPKHYYTFVSMNNSIDTIVNRKIGKLKIKLIKAGNYIGAGLLVPGVIMLLCNKYVLLETTSDLSFKDALKVFLQPRLLIPIGFIVSSFGAFFGLNEIAKNYEKLFGNKIYKKVKKELESEISDLDLKDLDLKGLDLKGLDLEDLELEDSDLKQTAFPEDHKNDYVTSYQIGELMQDIRNKLLHSEQIPSDDVNQLKSYLDNIRNDSTKKYLKSEVVRLIDMKINLFDKIAIEASPLFSTKQKEHFLRLFITDNNYNESISNTRNYAQNLGLEDLAVNNIFNKGP